MNVTLVDTTARDGLQNEARPFTTDEKVELVERCLAQGARRLEVASFVNPRAVPQMADAEAVLARLPRPQGVSYAGLVMNRRGLDRAIAAKVDEVDVVVVASDTFCRANQGVSTEQACEISAELVATAREHGLFTTVTIGAAFGCPFEGEVSQERLAWVVDRVLQVPPDELALADTIGVAVPSDVRTRLTATAAQAPGIPLRVHLHDTRHTAVANAVAALEAGVTVLDATVGGLGGCPFAPNATGNVALEDLIYLLDRMGVPHGLDLDATTSTVEWLEQLLGRRLPGAMLRAGTFPAKAA